MVQALRLTIITDSTGAVKGIGEISTKTGLLSRMFSGLSGKGKVGFGGLEAAMNASGLSSQFSGLENTMYSMQGALSGIGEEGKVSFGKIAIGAGVGLAAIAGLAETVSGPFETAQAKMDQAIKNSGASAAKLSGPIGAVSAKMRGFGHDATDTDNALATLTQGLDSPKKAIADMGVVANLAASENETLAAAAGTVVKVYAGNTKALRSFGINTTAMTKAGTAAVSAQKKQVTATEALTKAETRLSQTRERLGASGASKSATASKAVVTAQGELATAGQHLQQVQAKIATGTVKQTTAEADLATAQARVAAATAKYDAAQSRLTGGTTLTAAEQLELSNAEAAVTVAHEKASAANVLAAKTHKDLSDSQISGAKAVDLLAGKTRGYAAATSDTFEGKMKVWKADIMSFAEVEGSKLVKPLIVAGPALAGVGTIIETGLFGSIGRGTAGAVKGVGKLLGIVKPAATAEEALQAETAGAVTDSQAEIRKAWATTEEAISSIAAEQKAALAGLTASYAGLGEAAATASREEVAGARAAAAANEETAATSAESGLASKAGVGGLGTLGAGVAAYGAVKGAHALSNWETQHHVMGLGENLNTKKLDALAAAVKAGTAPRSELVGVETQIRKMESELGFKAAALPPIPTGPSVAHTHNVVQVGQVNVTATSTQDLINQLAALHKKANFAGSGSGAAAGGEL